MKTLEPTNVLTETEQSALNSSTSYPTTDIVSLPLPRKRVRAAFDIDVDFSRLPKRKPHVVISDLENAE